MLMADSAFKSVRVNILLSDLDLVNNYDQMTQGNCLIYACRGNINGRMNAN